MKITFESELMENQKHATVMAPDLSFEVLQSKDGASLFFSIDDSHNTLYLTREVTNTSTGWSRIELSKTLLPPRAGKGVKVKTFGVAQNAQSLAIDVALVATVDGVDGLYLSLGNANTDAAWEKGVAWTAIPFDAIPAPPSLSIADVFLLNIPGQGEVIFVDIERDPGNPLRPLDRYYITPGTSPQWNPHKVGGALAAGSISSCLGANTSDPLPGIYTFGTIRSEQELLFTPQYNYFGPPPPSDTRLKVPPGASAIASALNGSGLTNLFVSATDGLFLFTPDNQHDEHKGGVALKIVSNNVVAGASALAAATAGGQTAVWGVNAQQQLFYVMCPAGKEADPAKWSIPVPLLPHAEAFAFFLNLNAGNNVLFAQLDGQTLIQLTQDPVTTAWQRRAILLPPAATDDLVVFKSFTTHIQVTDDNTVGAPNTAVAVTATSPVSVYLNDVYHRLSPNVPVNASADATGVLTVVQETHSLSAVCFRVALTKTPEVVADIDPTSKAMARLGGLKAGELEQKKVTNADGTQQYLVPRSQVQNCPAATQSFAQLVAIHKGLPPDGSRQKPKKAPAASAAPFIWGVSFAGGAATYHEGDAAVVHFGLQELNAGSSITLASDRMVAAGDFWSWLKEIFEDVEHFFVTVVKGIYHFVVKIAGEFYHALLDCIDSLVHAVEFVFNKIKVFFEDLIKWLGFIFEWHDILRTHAVLKNILLRYAERAVSRIDQLELDVDNVFSGLDAKINAWAQMDGPGDTVGGYQASPPAKGQHSPGSHWAMHHFKSNLHNSSAVGLPRMLSDEQLGAADGTVDKMNKLLDRPSPDGPSFKQDFVDAISEFKKDIVDKAETLSAAEIIKRLIAIATKLLLHIGRDLIKLLLELAKAAIGGLMDALQKPLNIPILSHIYSLITDGDKLTFLDLACLIAAIPTTIICKLVEEKAPFPDDDFTKQLINAKDFASLQKLLNPSAVSGADAAISPKALQYVNYSSGVCGCFGALCVAVVSFEKYALDVGKVPRIVGLLACVSSLPYIMPNVAEAIGPGSSSWPVVTNDVVTTIWLLKTFTDNVTGNVTYLTWVSPFAEAVINAVWLVPPIAGIVDSHSNASDWVGLCANLLFDLGGIITPATSEPIMGALAGPEGAAAAPVVFAVQEVKTIGYGVLCAADGVLLLLGK